MVKRAKAKQVIERVVEELRANELFSVIDEASNISDDEIEAAMSRASAPGRGGFFLGSVMVGTVSDFPAADLVDKALEAADRVRRKTQKDIREIQKTIGKIERERGLDLDKIKEKTEDLIDPMRRASRRDPSRGPSFFSA